MKRCFRWLSFPSIAAVLVGCGSSSPTPSGRLVISEILYRSGSDSLEWIEIANRGGAASPLEGVSISGVGYSFPTGTPALPAGANLLLVSDPALFAARHPGVAVFGSFPGRLDDGGEQLQLKGGDQVLFEVKYSNDEPWPQGAAHGGSSLVYQDGEPLLASSWAASARVGGYPGSPKTPAIDRKVYVSEVRPADVAGAGFVEICSEASSTVDLGGWLLASSDAATTSLALPAGTSLAPGACTVISQAPATGGLGWGSLAPDISGGRLVLFERTSSGSLTGAAHGISWDALPEGASYARIGSGTGLLAVPTPGVRDVHSSLPLVAIQRICYQPSSGPEYMTLVNQTDSVIHLGNADSSLSWKVDGTGLRFAASDSLPARSALYLVATKDMAPALFRSTYGIAAPVPVLGYSGSLDNSGERITLQRPLVATTSSTGKLKWAPQAVDMAVWMPIAPWPADAAGGGACLERMDPRLPGDASSSWKSTTSRPGN